jgi:putative NIF3 family GTP cyclohydrolase 1 type 2
MKTFSAILILAFASLFSSGSAGMAFPGEKGKTAAEIISMIIAKTGANEIPGTVDVIKEGNPQTVVTGIVTTMFATMDVLKKAVASNCNLVIVHEPLYYNHLDNTEQFRDDPVFLEKKKYINDHNLVIWRFHDYIHLMKPDGIESGMVKKLGWEKYEVNGSLNNFLVPETTLRGLLAYLKGIFPKNAFYVIGDPEMKVSKVRLLCGAPGSMAHIHALEQSGTEVALAGEAQQWETYEYVRDAVAQGKKKAVVFLGHIASEEAGMDFCATWLKGFVSGISVSYIESGPSFWSY